MARNATLLALAASTLSACITIEPGSPGRAIAGTMSISDPEARAGRDAIAPGVAVWPRRWGDEIADRQNDSVKGVIVPVEGPLKAWQPRRHGPWHARLPRGNDTELVAALANGRADEQGYRFRMEGNGAFVFERDPDIPSQTEPVGRSDPAEMFVFVSGRIEEEETGSSSVWGSSGPGSRFTITGATGTRPRTTPAWAPSCSSRGSSVFPSR
jgi:hypothetical protein